MSLKKLIIIHGSITPFRMDFFNALSEKYDLKIYFFYKEDPSQKFDQEALSARIIFNYAFINKGFKFLNRQFRFGVFNIFRKEKPKVLITHEFASFSLKALVYKWIKGDNIRWYITSDDSLDILRDLPLYRKLARKIILPFVDGLICVNKDVKNWHLINYSTLDLNICVFPILQNPSVFRKNLKAALPISESYVKQHDLVGKKVFLFVGRLVKVKGIVRLIEVFSAISDPNIRLIIIGDGELRDNLEGILHNLKEKRVLLLGRFDGLELIAWYNVASLFILPSYYEPFGAVINEALLSGLFTLCSDRAGAKNLIQIDQNGALINPEENKDIHNKIVQFSRKVRALDEFSNLLKPNLMNLEFNIKINELIIFINKK